MWRYIINCELLYDGDILSADLCEVIATNRGLPADWCKRKFDLECLPSYNMFKNINTACELIVRHITARNKIQIIVDSDTDGVCSASIVYAVCKELKEYFCSDSEIVYSLHTDKQHGLSNDIKIEKDVRLVLIPDAGSNDIDQCQKLCESGINVICLDHHIIERANPFAVVVNCCDGLYPNKEICGTAVTWQFARAVWDKYMYHEDIRIENVFSKYLILVAVATISDVMDVTNEENMYYIKRGLPMFHNSPAIMAFMLANKTSPRGLTIEDVKFKITPYVNSMIRIGNMEEKKLLFRAFIEDYEVFEYTKRGSFEVSDEDIYARAARLCINAKSRQDREKKKFVKMIEDDPSLLIEDPHLVIVNCSGINPGLTGLIANEFAKAKNKPCLAMRKKEMLEDTDITVYAGSIRNFDNSPIESLKEALLLTGCFVFVQGHDNSAGFEIYDIQLDMMRSAFENVVLAPEVKQAMDNRSCTVDFAIDAANLTFDFIRDLSHFDMYSGHGFDNVTALVTKIKADDENFSTMGKDVLSWKVLAGDEDVSFVKFRVPKNDTLLTEMDSLFNNTYTFDAICTFNMNYYNEVYSAQAIVKDYEMEEYDILSSYIEDDDISFD